MYILIERPCEFLTRENPIKKVIFLIIAPLLLYAGFVYYTNPIKMPPYPYYFHQFPTTETKNAHVLIIGDHLGKSLVNYQQMMVKRLSKNLERPIKIENLSHNGEGLHRTLKKIQMTPKLPKIIIYYGGTEEFYEEIVSPLFLRETLYNLKYFQKEAIKTILTIIPELAPFVFKATRLIPLTPYNGEKKSTINEEQFLALAKIKYILYEDLLETMIKKIKAKNSNLIIITPPINLDILPHKVCPQTTSEKIIKLQNYAFSLIHEKKFEEAKNELEPLLKLMPSNPLTQYLLGKVLMAQGKIERGLQHLEMAAAFDCGAIRGNPVFIGIQKKLALKYDIPVIDYHQMLKAKMLETVTFLDDIIPQHLFNEELAKQLVFPIKKYLKL